ncbi:MAG: hypothetical protein K0S45_3003 [Nitrospira sp.]|jgi:hypothetical protein|nr:hypothetical protein [Nitrospira sp.]
MMENYKEHHVDLCSYESPDLGWVPKAHIHKTAGTDEPIHLIKGDVRHPFPTKSQADEVAKSLAFAWIDSTEPPPNP